MQNNDWGSSNQGWQPSQQSNNDWGSQQSTVTNNGQTMNQEGFDTGTQSFGNTNQGFDNVAQNQSFNGAVNQQTTTGFGNTGAASRVEMIGVDTSKKSVFGFSIMVYALIACLCCASGYYSSMFTLLLVIALVENDKDKNLIKAILSLMVIVLGVDILMSVVLYIEDPISGLISSVFSKAEYGSVMYDLKGKLKDGVSSIVSIIRWIKNIFLLYTGVNSMKTLKAGTFKPVSLVAKWFD